MLRADAVMSAAEPGLQVRKDEMDDGQKIFDDLWIAAFGDGVMVVAALPQARVAAPIVRNRERSRLNGARQIRKAARRSGRTRQRAGHARRSARPFACPARSPVYDCRTS